MNGKAIGIAVRTASLFCVVVLLAGVATCA
jgi:hypothetical protein